VSAVERVLVPTDGSDCAHAAVAYARDVAATYGADLHVLSVVDSRPLESAVHLDELRAERESMVHETHEALAPDDGLGTEVVRVGVPHEEVVTYVEEADVDLVVMGTHGRTGLGRVLLGSVAEMVVRTSPVPVLTVPEDASRDQPVFETVLVATDGSDGAERAADRAVDLAATYDASLRALSVVNPVTMGVDVRSGAVAELLTEAAEEAVAAVAERADAAGVTAETAVEYGQAGTVITEAAADADLVVVGTHGRTGLGRALLGSVAERVVRTSPVPVLTVPSRDEDSG
jgi:nucleotide-binding universal stress UspA family protein